MITFQLPSLDVLQKASRDKRMNYFRRYFALSRYNRLLIQQTLVRSAKDILFAKEAKMMEKAHNDDFAQTVERMKKDGYFEEFLDAVKEEDEALQKIIEAYDKRMKAGG